MAVKNHYSLIVSRVAAYLRRRLILILACVFGVALFVKFNNNCTDEELNSQIVNECTSYANGKAVGEICQDMCHPDVLSTLSCHSVWKKGDPVFKDTWTNNSYVFKGVKKTHTPLYNLDECNNKIYPSECDFTQMVKQLVNSKLNISIENSDARTIAHYQCGEQNRKRHIEMETIWSLLHSNEYLLLLLYNKFDIFARFGGTCGLVYVMENLNCITDYFNLVRLYDDYNEWITRLKMSIMILDFLASLEHNVPEPMHICDMSIYNFGITNDFEKLSYYDLEHVHSRGVVNSIVNDGSECKQHSDCDYLDCRSFCNLMTNSCQHDVANNNLQIVCEKIFLGWVKSGRLVMPGLLMGPRTPGVLIELLEQCANPSNEDGTPRAFAPDEIGKRIYDMLKQLINS